jgi:hypothetical protein
LFRELESGPTKLKFDEIFKIWVFISTVFGWMKNRNFPSFQLWFIESSFSDLYEGWSRKHLISTETKRIFYGRILDHKSVIFGYFGRFLPVSLKCGPKSWCIWDFFSQCGPETDLSWTPCFIPLNFLSKNYCYNTDASYDLQMVDWWNKRWLKVLSHLFFHQLMSQY